MRDIVEPGWPGAIWGNLTLIYIYEYSRSRAKTIGQAEEKNGPGLNLIAGAVAAMSLTSYIHNFES